MADKTLEAAGPVAARQPGAGPFKVIKPGQGTHVRWGTAIGAGVLTVAGAAFLYEQLRLPFGGNTTLDMALRTLIPVVMVLIVGYLVFWLVGRHRPTVDFLIATEGEMKKVNWSSRKEIIGATKVVIFTVFALGLLLFVADMLFMLMFSLIGVLKIPVWETWFGGAGS